MSYQECYFQLPLYVIRELKVDKESCQIGYSLAGRNDGRTTTTKRSRSRERNDDDNLLLDDLSGFLKGRPKQTHSTLHTPSIS